MPADIVVIGGINFDYLVQAPRLPGAGETVSGERLDEAPGGKGANQALAAARLGAHVAFVGRVGADARGRDREPPAPTCAELARAAAALETTLRGAQAGLPDRAAVNRKLAELAATATT